MNITAIAKLNEEATEIQSYLEVDCSEEMAELVERGTMLTAYIARTGKMLADAKYHQDDALKSSILNKMDTGLTPSILAKLVSADCKDINYLVNWVERLNKAATHQLEWVRSMVSRIKAEMQMGGWQT